MFCLLGCFVWVFCLFLFFSYEEESSGFLETPGFAIFQLWLVFYIKLFGNYICKELLCGRVWQCWDLGSEFYTGDPCFLTADVHGQGQFGGQACFQRVHSLLNCSVFVSGWLLFYWDLLTCESSSEIEIWLNQLSFETSVGSLWPKDGVQDPWCCIRLWRSWILPFLLASQLYLHHESNAVPKVGRLSGLCCRMSSGRD